MLEQEVIGLSFLALLCRRNDTALSETIVKVNGETFFELLENEIDISVAKLKWDKKPMVSKAF